VDKRESFIRRLTRMGYEIYNDPKHENIRVTLCTKSRYHATFLVSYIEIEAAPEELIIDTIVGTINRHVIQDI
jgi:hypothetical protein